MTISSGEMLLTLSSADDLRFAAKARCVTKKDQIGVPIDQLLTRVFPFERFNIGVLYDPALSAFDDFEFDFLPCITAKLVDASQARNELLMLRPPPRLYITLSSDIQIRYSESSSYKGHYTTDVITKHAGTYELTMVSSSNKYFGHETWRYTSTAYVSTELEIRVEQWQPYLAGGEWYIFLYNDATSGYFNALASWGTSGAAKSPYADYSYLYTEEEFVSGSGAIISVTKYHPDEADNYGLTQYTLDNN